MSYQQEKDVVSRMEYLSLSWILVLTLLIVSKNSTSKMDGLSSLRSWLKLAYYYEDITPSWRVESFGMLWSENVCPSSNYSYQQEKDLPLDMILLIVSEDSSFKMDGLLPLNVLIILLLLLN